MPKGTAISQTPLADGDIGRGATYARCKYKFSADGGVQGDIALFGATVIPSGAVILEAGIDVITILTSGGAAQCALKVEGAGDLMAASVISGTPWSTATRKNLLPQTFTTSVKTTAARDVTLTITVADLTAGEFDVYVKYINPV